MTALACPRRSTHGSDDDRRWHQAHGHPCVECWPDTDGLPPLPVAADDTAPGWLDRLITAEFGTDIPDGVAA